MVNIYVLHGADDSGTMVGDMSGRGWGERRSFRGGGVLGPLQGAMPGSASCTVRWGCCCWSKGLLLLKKHHLLGRHGVN